MGTLPHQSKFVRGASNESCPPSLPFLRLAIYICFTGYGVFLHAGTPMIAWHGCMGKWSVLNPTPPMHFYPPILSILVFGIRLHMFSFVKTSHCMGAWGITRLTGPQMHRALGHTSCLLQVLAFCPTLSLCFCDLSFRVKLLAVTHYAFFKQLIKYALVLVIDCSRHTWHLAPRSLLQPSPSLRSRGLEAPRQQPLGPSPSAAQPLCPER